MTLSTVREVRFQRWNASGKAVDLPGRAVAFAERMDDSAMLLAYVAAPAMVARAIGAMVRGSNEFRVSVAGFGVSKCSEDGYRVSIARLPGYSTASVLIVAADEQLLLGPVDEALWRYLMSSRISTPMLRAWLPQIRGELDRWSKIGGTNGFGYEVNVAKFESAEVDVIVSKLIKQRRVFV